MTIVSNRMRLAAAALSLMAAGAAPAYAQTVTEPPKAVEADERPIDIRSFSGAVLAAKMAEADNDLDDAVVFLRRALRYDPSAEDLREDLLLSLLSLGRFDEALEEARIISDEADVQRVAKLTRAVDALRAKRFKRANGLLQFENGNELDQLIYGVLRAWSKVGAGDAQAAIAELEALEGPQFFAFFTDFHKALIADVGGLPDANRYYRAVLDNRESMTNATAIWLRAVEAYASWAARNGRTEWALTVLSNGEDIAPDLRSFARIRTAVENGQKPRPFVASPRAGGAEMLYDLASVLNRRGSEPVTRLYLELARALAPQNDAVLYQLGGVSEQLDEPERAIAFYESIAADADLKSLADLQLGLNLADLERFDESEDHLRSAIEAEPNNLRAYLLLGSVHVEQEEFDQAAQVYEQALAREGEGLQTNWQLYYQRGIAYERQNKWAEGEASFLEALDLSPEQPEVLNYLGYTWVDRNENLERGLDMIRRAVELRPNAGYIVDSLGWAYYRLGRYDDAVTELEKAVLLTPEDATINDHLGDAYWRTGRRLEARFQWDTALSRDPEEDVAEEIRGKLQDGLPDTPENPIQARSDDEDGASVEN